MNTEKNNILFTPLASKNVSKNVSKNISKDTSNSHITPTIKNDLLYLKNKSIQKLQKYDNIKKKECRDFFIEKNIWSDDTNEFKKNFKKWLKKNNKFDTGNKILGDKILGDKILDDKNLDDKILDDKILDDKNLDDKNLDDKILDDKNLDDIIMYAKSCN
jgi:hypothetical protein